MSAAGLVAAVLFVRGGHKRRLQRPPLAFRLHGTLSPYTQPSFLHEPALYLTTNLLHSTIGYVAERKLRSSSKVRILHGSAADGRSPSAVCFRRYLNDFSKALASEVRILLAEVGKLRDERRQLQ